LIVPATVAEDADGGISLRADVDIDRSSFGMTTNPLGMRAASPRCRWSHLPV